MDTWAKIESNLNAVKQAGIQQTGEVLPRLPTGGPSKEQQRHQYQEAEKIRTWALSWKKRVKA